MNGVCFTMQALTTRSKGPNPSDFEGEWLSTHGN